MSDKYEWKVNDVYEVVGASGVIYLCWVVKLTKTQVVTAPLNRAATSELSCSRWKRDTAYGTGQGIYNSRRIQPSSEVAR